jgi:hypothetical protein
MIEFREPRRQVRLIAQLRCGEDWRRIVITNVTISGLRCEGSEPPAVGTTVEIRYQGFSIIGSVQWRKKDEFGVTCYDMVDVELLVSGSPEVDIGRRALPRLQVRISAEFVAPEGAWPVVVQDISPGGARLKMNSPPPRGKQGIVKWDGMECGCTVVWSGENAFGVIFGDELPAEPKPPAGRPQTAESSPPDAAPPQADAVSSAPAVTEVRRDRRTRGRVAVDWTCDVRHADSRRVQVQLSNISTEGCEIGWFAGCRENAALYIKMPNLSTVRADVVWKDDHNIGCVFSDPLNGWVLEHLLAERSA